MTRAKNFREIYESIDNTSPRTAWVKRMAAVAQCTENAVYGWLSGRQTPLPLTQAVIAKELKVPVEGLFPVPKKHK